MLRMLGLQEATRIMAKDLVRTRAHIKKMIMMKTQIQAVSLKIQTLKSIHSMAQAMKVWCRSLRLAFLCPVTATSSYGPGGACVKGVTKAMGRMNRAMNLPGLQKIMMEFEKENEMMEMKQEIMDDTIDDVMGVDDEETETEEVVNQVSLHPYFGQKSFFPLVFLGVTRHFFPFSFCSGARRAGFVAERANGCCATRQKRACRPGWR